MIDLVEGVRDLFIDAQQYTYDHVQKAWSDLIFRRMAQRAEIMRNYRATHRKASRDWSRKWRAENPEACRAAKQAYRKKHAVRFRAANKARLERWRLANPALAEAQRQRDNARRKARRAAS